MRCSTTAAAARSPVAHAIGRRGAADQPHHGARHVAREYLVRPRRALDRTARARCGSHRRRHEAAARCRQHAHRGGARSEGDAGRRSPDRRGARTRRARRPDRVPGPARRTRRSQGLVDRRLSPASQARRAPAGCRASQAARRAQDRGCARAQSQECRRRHSAQSPGVHRGCQRFGQIDSGPRHPVSGVAAHARETDGKSRRISGARRSRIRSATW